MTTYVPAARRLIEQVADHKPEAETTPGDVDGYGRVREVTFDAKTSKWLRPILEAGDDERIARLSDDKKMTVTFVPTVKADFRRDFAIDEADEVLGG